MQYEGSGDVFFAFYNGDEELTTMPKKDNPEGLGFDYAICDKGASVEWNSSKWAPTVLNLSESKTKCTLYFSSDIINKYIEKLAKKDTTDLIYDETDDRNLRYTGASPINYIDIGDKDSNGNKILWRIIGVMNNVVVVDDDGTTHFESLVKIIRSKDIGWQVWDTSASNVNSGWGVNEWSKADLMKLLNPGYEENKYETSGGIEEDSFINNSLYWNKSSGYVYYDSSNSRRSYDFSSTGLTESVKEKIVKVRWNTGTMPELYSENTSKLIASYMYEIERSENNVKQFCDSGSYCNDKVERHTTWDGYIGLMYPSDYGYAVEESVRTECLAQSMWNWSGSTPDCKGNDWLYTKSDQWTITPVPNHNS